MLEGRLLEVVEGRPQEDLWEMVLVPEVPEAVWDTPPVAVWDTPPVAVWDILPVVVWGKDPVAVDRHLPVVVQEMLDHLCIQVVEIQLLYMKLKKKMRTIIYHNVL